MTYLQSCSLIGDLLMQTPAIRALKKKSPEEKITYFHGTTRNSHVLLQGNPYLDELLVTDGPYGELTNGVDPIIDMDAWGAHGVANAFSTDMLTAFGYLLGVQPSEMDGLHYDYVMTAEEVEDAQEFARVLSDGKPLVIIARHSASCSSNSAEYFHQANKCLPNRMWVQVAEWLLKEGFQPVAVGSQEDAADSRYAVWPGKKVYGCPLRTVAGLIKYSHAVLSVDTGIRHLAAAVGTNLYCISGAVTLEHLRCHPQGPDHKIHEVYKPLRYITLRDVVQGAKEIL